TTAEDPQPWLELTWAQPQEISEIGLIFDDDVEEDLINLHHHRTPWEIAPSLVRNTRIEVHVGTRWTTLRRLEGNRQRYRRLLLDSPVTTRRLRLVVEETNGARAAHVVAIRAYEKPQRAKR